MKNERTKNQSDVATQTNQESGKGQFQASLDKHGFNLMLAFLSISALPCVILILLIGGVLIQDGTLSGQYQTILFTTIITLFGLLITGIFIFMTFRIDSGAKSEAREVAKDVAKQATEEAKQEAVAEAKRSAEEAKQQAIAEAKRIAEEAKRIAEEAKQQAITEAKQQAIAKVERFFQSMNLSKE